MNLDKPLPLNPKSVILWRYLEALSSSSSFYTQSPSSIQDSGISTEN
ncbi:MAG: hypothetical protein OFPII_43710 [Osedax symbiont Rs1]|nr:MAG: hypothetical protein OFPII_43710 [Osedax symbiont Rs1]